MTLAAALVAAVGLVVQRPPAPGPPAIQDSPFGIVCPWDLMKQLGASWARCGAGATTLANWASIHTGPGTYDWKGSDAELYGIFAAQRLSPLCILGYTPDWLSTGATDKQAHPPRDYSEYGRFVRQIVGRYCANVRYWEIWNEQDIGFWKGTLPEYVNLLKTGFNAAKSADPKAQVLFGGLAGANLPYLEQAYDYGAGAYFDVMSVHPYQWGDTFNDGWFVSQLVELRRVMNRRGDAHKPIWLTELGWSTGDPAITPQVQARMLTQSMVTALTLRSIGVEKVFWFSVKDWGGPGHGLLDTDGKPKPAYAAYQSVITRLKGLDYLGLQNVGPEARFHVFGAPGRVSVGVLWSADRAEHPVEVAGRVDSVDGVVGAHGVDLRRARLTARPDPIYVTGQFESTMPVERRTWPAVAQKPPVRSIGKVWMTLRPQEGTARPYVVRGGSTPLRLDVQNQDARPARLKLAWWLDGETVRGKSTVVIPPDGETHASLAVSVGAESKSGLRVLHVEAVDARGVRVALLATPVRVTTGPTIEFLANSFLDESYLVGDQRGGGAPSVRFGGGWTYRIPTAGVGRLTVSADVGAHMAGAWAVLVSTDGARFEPLMSGKSDRAWRSAEATAKGDHIWLRFEGDNVQLGELRVEAGH